jgi:hypothetical protein
MLKITAEPISQSSFLAATRIMLTLTLRKDGEVTFRPTCHYAYLARNEAMLSWLELLGGRESSERVVPDEAAAIARPPRRRRQVANNRPAREPARSSVDDVLERYREILKTYVLY